MARRQVRRGDIWWVDFNPSRGSEQAGRRPALVVQADYITEENSETVIVLAMSTGSHGDDALHVEVQPSPLNGLTKVGVVKCEQVLTVASERLISYRGIIEPRHLGQVEDSLRMVLGLG